MGHHSHCVQNDPDSFKEQQLRFASAGPIQAKQENPSEVDALKNRQKRWQDRLKANGRVERSEL